LPIILVVNSYQHLGFKECIIQYLTDYIFGTETFPFIRRGGNSFVVVYCLNPLKETLDEADPRLCIVSFKSTSVFQGIIRSVSNGLFFL